MASNLDLVYQNIIDCIQAITPTSTIPGKNFYHLDFKRIDPDQSSGLTRAFAVYWVGSDSDEEPTDMTDRWCEHTFEIDIAYSTDYELATLEKLIAQDRHDVIKKLRDLDNAITGQHTMKRKNDRLDMSNPQTWYLKQQWICMIEEEE